MGEICGMIQNHYLHFYILLIGHIKVILQKHINISTGNGGGTAVGDQEEERKPVRGMYF